VRVTTSVWGQLVGPVRRTLPWRALGAGGGVGLLFAGLPRLLSAQPDSWSALLALRAAALAFAMGLAFLLDDPARHVTAAVPTRRMLRGALRTALVAPVAALWWTAALLLVPTEVRPPVGDITLEAAATAVLTLAASAAAVRLTYEPEPGQRVAVGLLVSAVVAPILLPAHWALFVAVGDKRWGEGHERWALVLMGAAVVWAACGPEPVRRGLAFKRRSGHFSPSGA
jgi:fluoroquinolone transport system permease protein